MGRVASFEASYKAALYASDMAWWLLLKTNNMVLQFLRSVLYAICDHPSKDWPCRRLLNISDRLQTKCVIILPIPQC